MPRSTKTGEMTLSPVPLLGGQQRVGSSSSRSQLRAEEGSWPPHTGVLFAAAKCRGCSKLEARARRPRWFFGMVGESLWKSYITGLNCFRDLASRLDHRRRTCVVPMKPRSSQCREGEGSAWVICVGSAVPSHLLDHIASRDQQ